MKNSEPKANKKGFMRVIRVVRNTIFITVLVALVALVTTIIITRITGGVPSLFGYTFYRVSSGSMSPALEVGDVILTVECDPMELKQDDIVTYDGTSGVYEGKSVTHRVVKSPYKDSGETYINTKGDANILEDPPVNIKNVRSKMLVKISFMTLIYKVFVTPWGLIIIILLIILAFFNEIVNLVRAIVGGPEPKGEDVDDIIERYKKENAPEKTEPDSGND